MRHVIEVWWPHASDAWPWPTLLVNLVGAFAMGVVMGAVAVWGRRRPLLRPFLGVGVLGGFTTMSACALGMVLLAAAGSPALALGYGATTAVGAVGLAALGWRLTARWRARPSVTSPPPGDRRLVPLGAVLITATVVVALTAVAGAGGSAGWVALGALIGAPLRYLTDRLVQSWHSTAWPCGTLVVNVTGSLLLGLLVSGSPIIGLALGTGFCGAYTTWSTTAHESALLLRQRRIGYGVGYPVASVLLCVIAARVGVLIVG